MRQLLLAAAAIVSLASCQYPAAPSYPAAPPAAPPAPPVYSSYPTPPPPEENSILGEPYVNCAEDHIEIRFDTRNPFKGIAFVQGHMNDPSCRTNQSSYLVPQSSIKLPFEGCGVQRNTTTNPPGIVLSAKIVVAFQTDYLTKNDRVFAVQCTYMEMERTVEKEIKVNMPPPKSQSAQVPMPVCKYEVLDGSPEGPAVYWANVGQPVYHKWSCETTQKDTFCMTVHSCTVADGNGEKVSLIDENGCARDKYLLQNLEYIDDLLVGREAHVYKYADREAMYFDCQITLSIKEPGQANCPVPICPDPPRFRRSFGNDSDTDVLISEDDDFIIPEAQISRDSWWNVHFEFAMKALCMTATGLSSVILFNTILISLSATFGYLAIRTYVNRVDKRPF